MNTKSALSALCLCLVTGGANAAIVNYQSVVMIGAAASAYGNLPHDVQNASANDVTNYTNTVSASANASETHFDANCQCYVTNSASANASSSVALSADLGAGVFNASGSYGASSSDTNWLVAGADSSSWLSFEITTPYAYTLDMTASGTTFSAASFGNDHGGVIGFSYYGTSGFNVHQSGILAPGGIFSLHTQVQGCDAYIGHHCAGFPAGNFQYTLTLTPAPVPEPEVWGLMLSGLGLVGWAARRRKQADV